jgi:hypothetical protein
MMGYRSEVGYKIKFDKQEDFWGFIAEAKLDPDTVLCFDEDSWGKEYFEVDEENYEIRFLADSVKWYSEYDEVKCHEKLFDKARDRYDDNEVGVDGAFCRVGEEMEDLVEEYFGDDPYELVRISRQVVVDWM